MKFRRALLLTVGLLAVSLFSQFIPYGVLPEGRAEEEGDLRFLKILTMAYQVSCQDVESLRDFYHEDAEIIHNGRQVTLSETIKELDKSVSAMTKLVCQYEPKIRARRYGKKMSYLVVRETIRISAAELADQELQQICTYVFLKKGGRWKIAHDHCSSVPGLTV